MPFEEGKEKTGGRQKGVPNKTTRLVKEVFAETFEKLQQDPKHKAHLDNWAKENPTEFYKLASKLIPVQITGDADNPIPVNVAQGLTFEQLYQLKYGKKPAV